MKCKCDSCKFSKRVQKVLAGRSLKAARKLIEELHDMWFHTSDDLNYRQAIMDGSWPSAVEQLERALENARKIKKEREEKENEYARNN